MDATTTAHPGHDEFNLFEAFKAGIDEEAAPKAKGAGFTRLRAVLEVMRQLRETGGLSGVAAGTWFGVILQLVIQFGPQIADLVQRILDAIKNGQTPETFAG
jgi:hypothetical protein